MSQDLLLKVLKYLCFLECLGGYFKGLPGSLQICLHAQNLPQGSASKVAVYVSCIHGQLHEPSQGEGCFNALLIWLGLT